jgi:hypothetical protein
VTVAGTPDKYLTITFTKRLGAEDLLYEAVWASDLGTWQANGAIVTSVNHGNGLVTETWRAPFPTSVEKYFGRLRITRP